MTVMLLSIYGISYEFLVIVLFCYMLIAITFIDIDHFIIPNEFIIFGLIVSFFAHAFNFLPISILQGFYGIIAFGGTFIYHGSDWNMGI